MIQNLPKVCLGTMNFGSITNEKIAFEIMDTALAMGCNFFDTAELYAIPAREYTSGKTEEIIGDWMQIRNNRSEIFLATKVVGPSRFAPWIRNGKTDFDEKNIRSALQESLKRLQTDYIDLYQLHWPDRPVNIFGQRNFQYPDSRNLHSQNAKNNGGQISEYTPIEETLEVLKKLQKEGVVKHFGISNETPWGVSEYQRLEREKNFPKMETIQNNYSLLTRTYETSLAEFSYNTGIGLLAYSPLAFGALVDKKRKGGRFDTYDDIGVRYRTPTAQKIVKQYRELAHQNNMTLPEMALAFVVSQPFVQSVIIGPATEEQTKNGIEACQKKLTPEIFEAIEKIHEQHPNICP